MEYAGAGALAFKEVHNRFLPLRFAARLTELRRFAGGNTEGSRSSLGVLCENLERGYYLVRYHLQGSAFGTFFERKPVSVYMAVQAAQNSPAGGPALETQATRWLNEYFSLQDQTPRPDLIRPLVESIQAPWWTALPLAGSEVYQIEFGLSTAQDVWLLFDYTGEAGLQLEGLTLYRMELHHAALGN